MSQSLASAKKRRAPIQNEPLKPNSSQNTSSNPSYNSTTQPGLTLPQVIHIIDKRLTSLEKFALEQKEYNQQSIGQSQYQSQNQYQSQYKYQPDIDPIPEEYNGDDQSSVIPSNIKEVVEEFDKRYDMLAEEIVNLKNIVLSLQSYTMEVNKTLMEERGRIYDEIEKQNMENHED
jgi:hypothetical protein